MTIGSAGRILSLQEAVQFCEGANLTQISLETFSYIIQRCTREKENVYATRLHAFMHKFGLDTNRLLGNYLVLMLVEVGCICDAQLVFNRLPDWDEESCNSLLAGFVKCKKPHYAFALYQRMIHCSISVSETTFVMLLKACAECQNLETGFELHATATKGGLLENNLFVGSTMVDMYTKFGLLVEAQQVFDKLPVQDVVSWTAIMAGYVEHGLCDEALGCFEQMQHEGVSPNAVSYIYGLKACGSIGDLLRGKALHGEVERLGLLYKHLGVGSTLVDMYTKCGLLVCGREIFDKLLVQDVVSWTVLIAGYAEHGLDEEAFQCLEQMKVVGAFPNAVTIVCSLKACANLRATQEGQCLHVEIERQGLSGENHLVTSALITMYVKCGLLYRAQKVVDTLPVKDACSWTSLISAYTEQGYFEEAYKCFEQMEAGGYSPDSTALLCCLKACHNLGVTEMVQVLFDRIEQSGLLERDVFARSSLVEMYAEYGSVALTQQFFDKLPTQDVVAWTSLIAGYLEHRCSEQVLQCLEQAQQEGVLPSLVSFCCGLKACTAINAVRKGQTIHARFEEQRFAHNDHALSNILIEMYAKCGLLGEAEQVFGQFLWQDVQSWTALISGCVDHGDGEQALLYLKQMQSHSVTPSAAALLCSLKACISIVAVHEGLGIHAEIERQELFEIDPMISNTVVEFYARLGWLAKNRELFDRLPVRSIAAWNTLIAGCAEYGHGEVAIEYYEEMQLEHVFPNTLTFVFCLKACSISGSASQGQEFHAEIERLGFVERDPYVGSTLVDMYVKSNSLIKAQQVFDKLSAHDTVAWTTLIAGYVAHGLNEKALHFFDQMQLEGTFPNALTYICALKSCGRIGAAKKGQEIHVKVNRWDFPEKDLVGNSLVEMYANCGSYVMALEVFDKLPVRDALSWEAVIAGCVKHGGYEEAFRLVEKVQFEDGLPDTTPDFRMRASSPATDKSLCTDDKREKQKRFKELPVIVNSLVDLYRTSGSIKEAECVFNRLEAQDTRSWNAMMAGYADQELGEEVIHCFQKMQGESICPDVITLMCIVKACISIGTTSRIWDYLNKTETKRFVERDLYFGSMLVDFCVKCGLPFVGRQIFDMLPYHDSIVWTSLIAGYTEYEFGEEAVNCLEQMQHENVLPNTAALVCLLKACGSVGAVDKGRQIHSEIEARGLLNQDLVGNSLVSMYVKCGALPEARRVFDELPARDVVSWTSLMTGYGHLGESQDVLRIFDGMLRAAIQPDPVSFLVVLNACSRTGFISKSEMLFDAMTKVHGVTPSVEHFTCVVDLLSRGGHLDMAMMLIGKFPLSPNLATWQAVLSACTGWGNVELGSQVFDRAVCMDKQYAGAYVLMSHMYAGGGFSNKSEQSST